jgi:asparagine synthase (glutamine-hydrolysing)
VLPKKIALRQSKGGREEHAKDLVFNNGTYLRELLDNGVLVKHGLINKDAVQSLLRRDPTNVRSPLADLYRFILMETWAQSWLSGNFNHT